MSEKGEDKITVGRRLKQLNKEIADALDVSSIGKVTHSQIDALLKEQDRLFSEMAFRNLQGRDLEKSGRVEEAIKLYEQNVAEEYDTPFPYKRLAILYHKQKRFDDERKVIERGMVHFGPSYLKERLEKIKKPIE